MNSLVCDDVELGIKKRCTRCAEVKLVSEFYVNRIGAQGRPVYQPLCKPCYQRTYPHRGDASDRTRARMRAVQRAKNRLRHLVPELYDRCLNEELMKEGLL